MFSGSEWKKSAAAAHVLPLALFMLLSLSMDAVAVENTELPWWQHAPEHWLYPLQVVLCACLLWTLRRHYRQYFSGSGGVFGLGKAAAGWAVLLGVVGIAAWVVPALLYERWTQAGQEPAFWWEWCGLTARREGFDPTLFAKQPWAYGLTVGFRFLRMVIIVPWVEELFWRGYLMRVCAVQDGADWRSVKFGTHTWSAFAVVVPLVVLAHAPSDYAGALVWSLLMYGLTIRTRSLAACLLMHAVGNLLLGLYVLKTQQWGFW
jgi:uncharacterized protein